MNSSPPYLPTRSVDRTEAVQVAANAWRTESPAGCPYLSLTALKWSRSAITSDADARVRHSRRTSGRQSLRRPGRQVTVEAGSGDACCLDNLRDGASLIAKVFGVGQLRWLDHAGPADSFTLAGSNSTRMGCAFDCIMRSYSARGTPAAWRAAVLGPPRYTGCSCSSGPPFLSISADEFVQLRVPCDMTFGLLVRPFGRAAAPAECWSGRSPSIALTPRHGNVSDRAFFRRCSCCG